MTKDGIYFQLHVLLCVLLSDEGGGQALYILVATVVFATKCRLRIMHTHTHTQYTDPPTRTHVHAHTHTHTHTVLPKQTVNYWVGE